MIAEYMKIQVDKHQFSIKKFGQGEQPVLFFHGVNQRGSSFKDVFDEQSSFTFYCVDLPYHGETIFTDRFWTIEGLKRFYQEFLKHINHSSCIIAGYSMGAKVALTLIQYTSVDLIQGILLMAADGIHISSIYNLATRTTINRMIFDYTMSHPQIILRLGDLLKKCRLINPGQYKLLYQSFSKKIYIDRVHDIWIATAKMRPHTGAIIQKINQNNLPIYILAGKRDAIIPISQLKKFYNHIQVTTKGFFEYEFGHNFVHPSAKLEIKSTLKEHIHF